MPTWYTINHPTTLRYDFIINNVSQVIELLLWGVEAEVEKIGHNLEKKCLKIEFIKNRQHLKFLT